MITRLICRLKIFKPFSESPSYWIYTFETSRHWFLPISSVHLYIIRWNISLIKEGVTFGCFHVTALVCWQYQIRVYIILLRSGSHFDKRKVSKINKYWKFKSVMVTYPARNPYHVCIMVNIAPQCFYVSIYVSEYWI